MSTAAPSAVAGPRCPRRVPRGPIAPRAARPKPFAGQAVIVSMLVAIGALAGLAGGSPRPALALGTATHKGDWIPHDDLHPVAFDGRAGVAQVLALEREYEISPAAAREAKGCARTRSRRVQDPTRRRSGAAGATTLPLLLRAGVVQMVAGTCASTSDPSRMRSRRLAALLWTEVVSQR